MELNIKIKMVQSKNYITSDGKQFENYKEAEKYEKFYLYKKYQKEFEEVTMPIIHGSLIKVKDYERFELLRFYYSELECYVWNEKVDFSAIQYPCYITYGNYGEVYYINNKLGEELYNWYNENKEIIEKNKKV